ncbi:MAG: hypothetical protein GX630_08880, partial [Actinobacteria bacterium]|nr:hypothetical protein [Actinomycetota bacterium]
LGTLAAPFLYEYVSGFVISLAGIISIIGLVFAAPVLYREWERLKVGTIPSEKTAAAV